MVHLNPRYRMMREAGRCFPTIEGMSKNGNRPLHHCNSSQRLTVLEFYYILLSVYLLAIYSDQSLPLV